MALVPRHVVCDDHGRPIRSRLTDAMPPGAARPPDPPSGSARRAEFESLYEHHSREVWAIAYARWTDSDLAMDVTQEAFLRLWKQWDAGGEDIQNPRAWLLRVARNLAEDYAKSAFRRNGTQPPETMNGVASRDILPLERMAQDETFGQLREEMERLPQADREVLTLRYALDYNATEIAEILE